MAGPATSGGFHAIDTNGSDGHRPRGGTSRGRDRGRGKGAWNSIGRSNECTLRGASRHSRIGRVWYTAGIGEANCQRRGRAFEEDGGAEPVRARRGHERALEHGTRGMVVENGLLFMPTNLTKGIDVSDDPILNTRTEAYGESYGRRIK